jgi:hypothetical protein
MNNQPFIRGEQYSKPIPLEEFLPAYRSGVVSSWLNHLPSRPDLVISPFGDSPLEVLEAAAAGFRVVVPIHNPITRFLLNRLTQPSSKEELNTALVRLASSYKGKERLKPFILSLYETECPHCGHLISAISFTWSKSRGEPVRKTCLCSDCGEPSETPVSQEDLQKALTYKENSPSHARALTRVAAPDDPVRFQAEGALRTYPPRTVYALFSILNKLTGFDLTAEERINLEMLLLHAFYRCSSLRSSSILKIESGTFANDDFYREENVWFALEEALEIWGNGQISVPVVTWPDLPSSSGGISIYPGRVRDLIPQLKGLDIGAALMVFPKPNLSFWALSALWTGWLWGQEAAAPLRNILSLKNLDWVWLTRAIKSTLSGLKEILPPGVQCFGLLPNLEKAYLISVGTAACATGFTLTDIAVDPDLPQGQIICSTGEQLAADPSAKTMKEIIRSAGFEFLKTAGEPKHTLSLYSAGLASIASEQVLRQSEDENLSDIYNQLVKNFEESIAYRQGFLHFSKSETWWHQELSLSPDPHSDQVEQALVNHLAKNSSPLHEVDIYAHLYHKFPGLDTPQQGLIEVCLRSYAEKTSGNQSGWVLRSSDQPSNRRQDIKEIAGILSLLGNQLGFEIKESVPIGNILNLIWHDNGETSYTFYISASGILNRIITGSDSPLVNPWIILPGSRAELIHYKMENNNPLAETIQNSWGLIKYRHIRRIADEGGLTKENLQERLALDPFTSDAPQLPLI